MLNAVALPLAAAGGSGLVDLLVARRLVGAPERDIRAYSIELEVTSGGAVPDDAYLVLGVAGVGYEGGGEALVGVVARTRALERLADVPALGFLGRFLADRVLGVAGVGAAGQGRYGHPQHHGCHARQKQQPLQNDALHDAPSLVLASLPAIRLSLGSRPLDASPSRV